MTTKQQQKPVYDLVQTLTMWRRENSATHIPTEVLDDIITELERLYALEADSDIAAVLDGLPTADQLPARMRS